MLSGVVEDIPVRVGHVSSGRNALDHWGTECFQEWSRTFLSEYCTYPRAGMPSTTGHAGCCQEWSRTFLSEWGTYPRVGMPSTIGGAECYQEWSRTFLSEWGTYPWSGMPSTTGGVGCCQEWSRTFLSEWGTYPRVGMPSTTGGWDVVRSGRGHSCPSAVRVLGQECPRPWGRGLLSGVVEDIPVRVGHLSSGRNALDHWGVGCCQEWSRTFLSEWGTYPWAGMPSTIH